MKMMTAVIEFIRAKRAAIPSGGEGGRGRGGGGEGVGGGGGVHDCVARTTGANMR